MYLTFSKLDECIQHYKTEGFEMPNFGVIIINYDFNIIILVFGNFCLGYCLTCPVISWMKQN